jgi:hypothetical protein
MTEKEDYKIKIEKYKEFEEKARETLISLEPALYEKLAQLENESAEMPEESKKKMVEKVDKAKKEYHDLVEKQAKSIDSMDKLQKVIGRIEKDILYSSSEKDQKKGDENNG